MTYSDDDMLIKHGKPKKHQEDEVQLAAQAMCMEEQYGIHIEYGAIFYAEIRHRIEVAISERITADCNRLRTADARDILVRPATCHPARQTLREMRLC